jgi:hypothetical protein
MEGYGICLILFYFIQDRDIEIYVSLTNHKTIYLVKITFDSDKNLNEKLRKTIASSKGLYRGAIQEALIEAIHLWITSTKGRRDKIKKTSNKNENNKDNDKKLNDL